MIQAYTPDGPQEHVIGDMQPVQTYTPGGAAAETFVPTDLASLVAWYDFSDGDTVFEDAGTDPAEADDAIQQLNDKESTNHLVQATVGDRPTWKAAVQNSLSIGRFVTGKALSKSGALITGTSARTLFIVLKANSIGINYILSDGTNSTGAVFSITPEIAVRINGGFKVFDASTGTTNFVIVALRHAASANVTDVQAWLNGGTALGESSSSARAINIGTHSVNLGVLPDDPNPNLDADLGEIVYCNAELSTADMNSVGNYLADKWGLTWVTIS